ncbi:MULTISPECIES: 3-hydroxyacyl-ACP dehydratase FabZ [unclassified Marinitoga]|uniref:3-hydroxyacyl-ACP dehydratase FabZ n=1 Tax=unclassified Marinitoga TaxID=2640159 RepID=UPI0006416CD0|nr:3-hydroxyacyl-ACP dehydratase FabZ [Marinitoga sp. 1155]KLO24215.1 hydroxymyristoyl-ACP dehydratase [Marinitoga sp. 1155]NUU99297.1 hydroxymyristoyl-ACP dehydratase [Marinitoga sp. 1154]
MGIDEIMEILPHRYPFLLVDKVIEITEEKIIAYKNISINEPQFQGHFPGYPIMPGVLIIEGLAQTAGILLMKDLKEKVVPLFLGIDKARFKKEVRPGDKLMYEVMILQEKMGMYKLKAVAKVEDKIVATAELMVGIKRG